MAGLSEVPTDELLSFQDYPTIHTTHTNVSIDEPQIKVESSQQNMGTFNNYENKQPENIIFNERGNETNESATKSFWTIEYYQQFFDVDTRDVVDRITYSMFPRNAMYRNQMKAKPDFYGPFWIGVTLVFTIAVSGNIANYLQHANKQVHWKYDFHVVSQAATAIFLYITLVPLALWAILKWSINVTDGDDLEDNGPPGILELICFYGYSLFIYIPVSILWTIQVNFLQWILVAMAACISGSVLLLALSAYIRLSRHRLFITIGIISFHLLLAAGFMLYFFHTPHIITEKINTVQVTKGTNHTR